MAALVLLGADPLADFPDRRLAERALEGADFVVAVATAPAAVTRPCRRGAAGRRGPRAPRHHHQHRGPDLPAGPEARPPRTGLARLDDRLASWPSTSGPTSASTRSATVWDEIERLAPSYRGITRAVLDAHGAADGVVAPLTAARCRSAAAARPARPDRRARRGVGGAPGAPARRPAWPPRRSRRHRATAASAGEDGRPVPGRPVGTGRLRRAPRVAARRLLGAAGGLPCASTTTAPRWPPSRRWPAWWRRRPAGQPARPRRSGGRRRADRSGCARRRPRRWSRSVPDPSLPRKVVAADFNVPLDEGTVADLIDHAFPVTDLRMETP